MNLLLAVGQAGVTLALPHGWGSIPLALPSAPPTSDPVTRIAVASSPIRFGRCGDVGYRFAANGVAVVVLEYRRPTPGRFAPRPRRFRFPLDARLECGERGGSVSFGDHGRRFIVFVLVGPRATAVLKAKALRVLDTLRVH